MSDQTQYYLALNGQTAGPFTLDQVRQLYAAGTATAETLYCAPGGVEWVPLGTIAALLQAPAVPPAAVQLVTAPVRARIQKMSSNFGGGCLLQGLGIVCLLMALGTFFSIVGPIIFGLLGLWMLVYGSQKATWLVCFACGGKVAHKKVQICPHCHASF